MLPSQTQWWCDRYFGSRVYGGCVANPEFIVRVCLRSNLIHAYTKVSLPGGSANSHVLNATIFFASAVSWGATR